MRSDCTRNVAKLTRMPRLKSVDFKYGLHNSIRKVSINDFVLHESSLKITRVIRPFVKFMRDVCC